MGGECRHGGSEERNGTLPNFYKTVRTLVIQPGLKSALRSLTKFRPKFCSFISMLFLSIVPILSTAEYACYVKIVDQKKSASFFF